MYFDAATCNPASENMLSVLRIQSGGSQFSAIVSDLPNQYIFSPPLKGVFSGVLAYVV